MQKYAKAYMENASPFNRYTQNQSQFEAHGEFVPRKNATG